MAGNLKRCAVVTGGNKGIGFHCVEQLDASLDRSYDAAVEKLCRAASTGGSGRIAYHQCDIASDDSVDALRSWIAAEYGGVDLLINNAGFAYQGKSEDVPFHIQALETVGINFFGTLRISNALIPLLRPHARIVNVASMAGISAINSLDDEKLTRIRDPAMSEETLCEFMREFVDAAAEGDVQAQGWPENSYGMSKLGVMAMTRLHAQHPHVIFHDAAVNSCCPGWCLSEMSATIAANNDTKFAKSAAQGADSCCWIATLPRNGGSEIEPPNGFFVRPKQLITDRIVDTNWAEWTSWSGANGGGAFVQLMHQSKCYLESSSFERNELAPPGEHYLTAEKEAMAAATTDDDYGSAPTGIRMDGGSKM